jgi:CrcB protein
MNWIYIAISSGAILGALSRYYLTLFSIKKWGSRFAYGTLSANLTGSCLIGFIVTFTAQKTIPVESQKFLLIGFLGAYTTFSSYILESANLFRRQKLFDGLLYWLGTPILGFMCLELGIWLGQKLG